MTLLNISSTQKSLAVPRKKIGELVKFVEKAEKVRFDEVDVAVVSGQKMAWCNRTYLNHTGQTDVITFDLSDDCKDEKHLAGQIIVCSDVAVREARKRNLSARNELLLYVLHGLLHIIGYDDQQEPARTKMHQRQEKLLEKFLGN